MTPGPPVPVLVRNQLPETMVMVPSSVINKMHTDGTEHVPEGRL